MPKSGHYCVPLTLTAHTAFVQAGEAKGMRFDLLSARDQLEEFNQQCTGDEGAPLQETSL